MARLARGSTLGPYPYRILHHIGDGGTSSTYLATVEGEPDEPVVIKVTPADHSFAEQALMNEMQHLRHLDHPGIVRRHRVLGHTLSASAMVDTARASVPGKPWFSVLEYLSGGSLDELLAKHKPLPVGLALAIGAKLADALAYMHSRDIIHLDLKPPNVLFRGPLPEGIEPVLIDFGIARGKGQTGLEGGTRAYCAPERLLAELDVNHAAAPDPAMDVYSLGIVLFEMLLGKRPFEKRKERTTNAMMHSPPTRPSALLPELSHDIDTLLLQSLARDPAERPTAAQMAARLQALADSSRYRAYELPDYRPAHRASARATPALLPLFGIGTLALLLTGAFMLIRPAPELPPTPTATIAQQAAPAVATRTPRPPTRTPRPPTGTPAPTSARATSTPRPTFTPQSSPESPPSATPRP